MINLDYARNLAKLSGCKLVSSKNGYVVTSDVLGISVDCDSVDSAVSTINELASDVSYVDFEELNSIER